MKNAKLKPAVEEKPILTALMLDMTLTNCGMGVMDIYDYDDFEMIDIDLVETKKTKAKGIRVSSDDLARAREVVVEVTKMYERWNCNVIIAEMPSGTQSSRAAFSFGVTTGILACLAENGTDIIEVTATEVKVALTGNKNAGKKAMIDQAFRSWPNLPWKTRRKLKKGEKISRDLLTDKNEHMADCCGVGLAGLKHPELRRLVKVLAGRNGR